ncbi:MULTISPECIES: RidA family protein [Variovorax]|jgi:enamine deaminase RidA (YjgF/YER057c/UK114 family)|uniref:RidA family protein n=1 Tax=Variovorax TaxID=34072 RepID=UPI00086DF6E2|nr:MULTISPECIES: RidA family protein [Variovorax]MBN8751816.1 RidA family protein [Variovorax sp.]ODU17644.1 MAG: translation initiation inhibitor, yjgF family protein [Variovorax sp. SCN 67-85]ODV27002.1 MAG: translation initiation inhibitor, yjgF family protein [Variovorax sp. SCN 67-20]OJZ09343.1 MAG: translation initiation inhibitor, yjgF family protein [Variovorax sp. 67-131]UKI04925.1 RidA family protein [Variovorax paradoxus]
MNIIRHEMGPRFSEMVTVDLGTARLIYLSGQVAENPSLDITGQMREILQHIDAMLATQGATRKDLVSVTIYLRTVGDYEAMNSVWDEWVPAGHTPARATVGAKLIDSEYRVEIQATAAIAGAAP